MILDTHVWVWNVQGDRKLPEAYRQIIEEFESIGLGIIIAIKCD
jgi:PIN domain nuclease of toxin-antitoxin system